MPHLRNFRESCAQNCDGKEIIELHPIVLGGSPTDPKNKVVLDRKQHIEAVRYWNEIIREFRNKGG